MTDSASKPRRVTPRGWTTLGLAGAAVGLAVGGPAMAAGFGTIPGGPETLWLAQAAAGTEGGEAGEAGAALAGDETVDLLYDLGVLEGALRAGVALYRAGKADPAAPHLKRPGDDSYDELSFHLADAGAEGFPDELTALADAAQAGRPVAEVEAAFAAVLAKIDAARVKAGASEAEEAQAIVAILRKAAEDYAEGVKDGSLAEPGEYQEAWGLAEVARGLAARMAAETSLGVSPNARMRAGSPRSEWWSPCRFTGREPVLNRRLAPNAPSSAR